MNRKARRRHLQWDQKPITHLGKPGRQRESDEQTRERLIREGRIQPKEEAKWHQRLNATGV